MKKHKTPKPPEILRKSGAHKDRTKYDRLLDKDWVRRNLEYLEPHILPRNLIRKD